MAGLAASLPPRGALEMRARVHVAATGVGSYQKKSGMEGAGRPAHEAMTRPEFSAAKDIFELPLSLVRFGDSSLNFVRISSKNQTSLGGTPYGSFAFLQDHRWMDPRASRCGLRGCTAPPVRRPELCLELEALVCV